DAGQYVTNVQLAEAGTFERTQLAQSLWYLYHDFSEDARGQYFSESMFTGGFPDSTARIAEMLADDFMRDTITTELSRFADDYRENPGLLRFHYHKADILTEQFRELVLPRREYSSELAEIPPVQQFITQDEIHDVLTSGSNVSGGKERIYDYFTGNHSQQELQEFLKNEYGIGGRSHALSGAAHSNEWHDGRGIRPEKPNCTPVELLWTNVTKRIYEAIRDHTYFTPEEWEQRQTIEEAHAETEPIAVYTAEENNLPYDIVIERLKNDDSPPPENFRITDDNLGTGGAKAKFRMNMDAIHTLKRIESENRHAAPEEQEILSKYVGWGGLPDAFDDSKENWRNEYAELSAALTPEEYEAARASTLNAHYTSPTVIKAIYEAVSNMGFQTGNILEPSMGVGNFFGLLPEEMSGSKLYGVELDSITGRIAKQLYPNADITVAGFETTDRRDFFDLAVGNVPFGQYKVNDKAYNRLNFSIHDYFFAKTLDQVRPGGVIAFITSRYTMDKESPEVRKYIAERADLLGAIRLPNNAFKANAGTEVVSDILFLQKRDRPQVIEPDWVHLGQNEDGFVINSYFIDHPEMILGRQSSVNTQYGRQDFTVEPTPGLELADQLHDAVRYIRGTYTEAELPDLGDDIGTSLPADPNVKNYSYTVVDGDVYYRENSRMVKPNLNATAQERVKGMVELRDCVQNLIDQQLNGGTDEEIVQSQAKLNQLYDDYTAKYGLINDRANRAAFADDSSYYLLCSLEILDEEQKLKRKADMFTKRTIKQNTIATSVDTAAEALALSISEKARVDMPYMSQLTGKSAEDLASELRGVIFRLPESPQTFVTADEYLSGNVREKLAVAERYAEINPDFSVNVEALRAAQPKDLDASEIEVRLGATWIDKSYIREFMLELLDPPFYLRRKIDVNYSEFTAEWNISGKSVDSSNINSFYTYGTDRASAYRILEDTLNLRDVRIYDTVTDADGKERRVLNAKETTLAQQKQQAIKDAFQEWIWKTPDRRHALVQRYNELFNSTRPREYNGEHITFNGMNPEISLREHQKNAVAHILYGGNTLLAHEVGAGKTFEMVAAAMESKRLGLCNKPLFAVPNHLTEQWASEFLRLYPSANILVTTKKDFEPANRKKFCARIATGNYDAIIMGHSQFEKIPMSKERQEQLLQSQINEITDGIAELQASNAERFTIKQLERTRKSLEARLSKLQDDSRKDDVITFEQLGVDRLYVDEAHNYKNLFLYTKMRNVAGLSTTDAQKSSDMFMKCRYLDEITGSKGVVFATGTPVSNSMTELYTMMRYLQHDTLEKKHLNHFDAWASTFGETTTAIELAPEGT
ncbi:MAG: DEAD/DEAH box helicase family protein, partial [Clostridia bacterium]|nr:DEAD/DEAH box helicase family protein [Clostridia bacterium]